jgi:transcriptional regulator with XRE-family HTH domain
MKNTVRYQYKSIIEKLVFLRKMRRLSQEKLALEIGVDTKLFGEWERMVREPRLFNLLCWCEALQVYLIVTATDEEF